METNDMEVVEISDSSDQEAIKNAALDSVHAKRRLRRGSSLFGSPQVHRDSGTDTASLLNKLEPGIKCDSSDLNTELRDYCNRAPDMVKFAADAKDFIAKLAFYKKMENYHAKKMKYAEDRLKESVNEVTAKLFVDEIDEKIYLE